jgi:hypothetical protein
MVVPVVRRMDVAFGVYVDVVNTVGRVGSTPSFQRAKIWARQTISSHSNCPIIANATTFRVRWMRMEMRMMMFVLVHVDSRVHPTHHQTKV